MSDGDIPVFAPHLTEGNENFEPEAQDWLDRVQAGSFWFRARNRLIIDLVHRFMPTAGSVLEIGCGTGYVLKALREALPASRIFGSEVDRHALALARRRIGDDIGLFQMDARAIPFSDEFDLICAFDVIEHVDEDMDVLAEINRALKPDGAALLAVPQHPFLWGPADDYGKHKRRYRVEELSEKCRAAGLKVEFSTSFVSSLLPFMAANRIMSRSQTNFDPEAEFNLPPWLDRVFEIALDTERLAIRAGMRLPFGGSRFVFARVGDR